MAKRYFGLNGYTRKQTKIAKRIVKAYRKLNLISNLKKENGGYSFDSTEEIMRNLRNELFYSFTEAGLD